MSDDINDIKKLRMPVFSWDYEDLSEADRWFFMARAYFDCSYYLFAQMVQECFDRNYHRALVAVFLFEHSVELFLEAAVIQAGRTNVPSHDLEKLYRQYCRLYPGKKYQFQGEIASIVTFKSNTPHNEFARYPVHNSGRPWPGYSHVDVAIWFVRLDDFGKDFDRLEPLMKERYPSEIRSDS